MYRVLINYSFNGDDGSVTTAFINGLRALNFTDAGTAQKRSANLTAAQLQQFLQLLASNAHGAATRSGASVNVDHFIVVIEPV